MPGPAPSLHEPLGAPLMQRLTSRQQFQAVMTGGPVAKTPHFALHRTGLSAGVQSRPLFPVADTWLGVLLPKRWARRAVTRNTIRRQIYEVARAQSADLPQAAFVVRLRSGFSRELFPSATSDALKRAVRSELSTLMARATGPAVRSPAPEVTTHAL